MIGVQLTNCDHAFSKLENEWAKFLQEFFRFILQISKRSDLNIECAVKEVFTNASTKQFTNFRNDNFYQYCLTIEADGNHDIRIFIRWKPEPQNNRSPHSTVTSQDSRVSHNTRSNQPTGYNRMSASNVSNDKSKPHIIDFSTQKEEEIKPLSFWQNWCAIL